MIGNNSVAVLFEKAGPVPSGSKTLGGCELALAIVDIRDVLEAAKPV